jgi:hypothetical protein
MTWRLRWDSVRKYEVEGEPDSIIELARWFKVHLCDVTVFNEHGIALSAKILAARPVDKPKQ